MFINFNTMKNKYFEAGLSKLALAFLALIIALPMTFMPSVANAISPTTIFSDGFEAPTGVGNWIESGWSSSSDGHGVGKSAKLVGAENAQTMQKNISTSGYENISLSFWYKAYDLDTSGHLDKVEVFYTLDGSSWVEVSGAQIDDNDDDNNWHQFSFSSFPSGANNNLNFGVKFDGDLNSDNDKVWVDDVSLTGASIPVPVNGGWSEWSPSSCPTAPGSPESQLVRTCTNPTPANGGRECQGEATQVCAAVPADTDQDGVPDYTDNCPSTANSNQEDRDGDGVGDACDNCISNANANQADENQNGVGDICEVPDEPTTGTIKITKYACPADTSVVRSANGVEGTVPPLCELQSGATFGFVHGTQTDANAPYPELTANLTAGGTTDGSGVLNITDLPADGRYLVVETDGNNTKIPDGDILGLYCVGDGDTSNNNDNQELTFVSAGGTVNCVAYNKAKEVPAPVCDPEKNLIANGGFENPLVETPEKWNTFASGFTGLEWIVNWLNPDGAPTVANLELHKTGIISGWNALEGVQYAELDTDFGAPPSNPGGAASVSIAQEIQTIPGKNYKLTFDFSPRPNRDTTENVLGVFWGGEQVPGSPVSAAGNGTNNVWAPYTFNFSATTSL
ncbi:MAG: thrombospondin type 3 repeat-containing protein, partial [Candidatus Paceibacterota bacterium]